MKNNILLDKPKIKFESHRSMSAEFPFVVHPYITHFKEIFSLHENIELLYFMDGSGAVLYDGVRYPVEKGDLVAVNSYSLHQVMSDGELPHFCVIISRDFCLNNSIDPSQLVFRPTIHDDAQATALFRQIMDAYADESDRFRNTGIKSAVLALLLYLCRHYSTPRNQDPSATSPTLDQVRRALSYMKSNFHKKITVDDIAASAGLSKFHFLRQFKRITGRTPTHYLNAIRCEHARNLLESGQCSVKEVAFQCGFTNGSYFSNVFRQYTGLLPSQVHPTY